MLDNSITFQSVPVSNVDTRHEIKFLKNNVKLRRRPNAYPLNIHWQTIRIHIHIRSNEEITIRMLSVSVRIADIRKISIHGYISAHLCAFACLVMLHVDA